MSAIAILVLKVFCCITNKILYYRYNEDWGNNKKINTGEKLIYSFSIYFLGIYFISSVSMFESLSFEF